MLVRATVPSGGDALGQAVAASFLARDFVAADWAHAAGAHLVALYGAFLVPAALAAVAIARRPAPVRRVLLVLLAAGLANVTLFARHATGHEHFWLLLAPYVALSTATLLCPREALATPPRGIALALFLALAALGTAQALRARPEWDADSQSRNGASFRAATTTDAVYVRPGGSSFVFLYAAGRHVSPDPAGSLAEARAAAGRYRDRFGLGPRPAFLALDEGEPVPDWVAALGPPLERGPWRLWPLDT